MSYEWKNHASEWFETGSRVVCNPTVLDTDHDFVVYDPSHKILKNLNSDPDWEFGGSEAHDGAEFTSFRNGDVNVILIDTRYGYHRFELATKIAKLLNVADKKKRVALFEAIRHGVYKYD